MSGRDIRLSIDRLVVHDDAALSAADLEAAIGQAIRQRLEGPARRDGERSLPERIADGVLGHPRVAAQVTPGGG
jgi:hypothetical protein